MSENKKWVVRKTDQNFRYPFKTCFFSIGLNKIVMKKLPFLFVLFIIGSIVLHTYWNQAMSFRNNDGVALEENPEARAAYFRKLLADPATGEIPSGMRSRELAFDLTLPVYRNLKRSDQWMQRGPNLLGGRTRAIAINTANPSEMLAGGVTGGIYKSLDGGKYWSRTNCPMYSITCLVQDQRQGKSSVWYAGTGELLGSSGSAIGAYNYGGGILKSTDGGNTWTFLASTEGKSKTAFDKDFDFVFNIVIDNTNLTEDEIYAATYGSVYRSLNGGTTWQAVLSGVLSASDKTEVAISPTGVLYATLSSNGNKKGVWRSPDGVTWTNILPAGFPATYGRIAIGIAPSDEKQVYFLVSETTNVGLLSVNFQGDKEWNSLWKYDFVSGNGAGSGGTWADRSSNLPGKNGDFGQFSSQGGYDLYVRIKPDDANTVFLGGTNLWRSSDGFTTLGNTAWIGGYAVNTMRPDFKLYANHHPDQHNLIFYPGSTVKAFSAHDGGISLTQDITASSVTWESMNNNYITSQFYTITIDHANALDKKIVGGLQDNGTHYLDQSGLSTSQMPYNGDGSYCAIKDGTNEIFASAQLGRIAHIELDGAGSPVKFARIDPAQLYRSNYDFINPFSVDPNNQNIMYLPAKKRLFRNLDITAKAMTPAFDSTRWNTPLWEVLTACVPASGEFSAIVTSRCNPNTLYYATDAGKLYRVRNANVGQPVPVDISGTNFSNGNIGCIALDPIDSNRMMVVFTNYNINSLFATEDGGKTWINVSGNLEENTSGTGAGPSCRWAAVMPLQNGKRTWFVGTSTGLYATSDLMTLPTVWLKQSPEGIGSVIVTMIDVRPQDYFIAVATHGAGIFSATIANEWQTTGVTSAQSGFQFKTYPNPLTNDYFNVTFSNQQDKVPDYALYDASGNKVGLKLEEDQLGAANTLAFATQHLPAGIYWLMMKTEDRKWVEKITVIR